MASGTNRLEREEDLDRTNLLGQRQPFPVGDNYGQAVQAIRPLPVEAVSDVVPLFERAVMLSGAPGAGLSAPVVTNYARIVNIAVSTWTSAAITFQGQAGPGESWLDIYDETDAEVTIVASTHNRIYSVPGITGMYAIKIRSGVSGSAVNQAVTREIPVFGSI